MQKINTSRQAIERLLQGGEVKAIYEELLENNPQFRVFVEQEQKKAKDEK